MNILWLLFLRLSLSPLHVSQPLKAINIPYFFTVSGLITFDFR